MQKHILLYTLEQFWVIWLLTWYFQIKVHWNILIRDMLPYYGTISYFVG